FDAPRPAPKKGRIEIQFQYLRFGERLFDARRQHHLANLAFVGDIFADQNVLDHLLGDGRASLWSPGLRQITDEGADQRAFVDPLVLVEAFVLRRNKGSLDVHRDFTERHPDSPIVRLKDLGKALPLAVKHDAGAWQAHTFELPVIG